MVEYKVYTAAWNKSSNDLREMVNTFSSQFFEGKTIDFLPLEDYSWVHSRLAIRVYPTVTKIVDGEEVARKAGDIDLIGLVEFLKD